MLICHRDRMMTPIDRKINVKPYYNLRLCSSTDCASNHRKKNCFSQINTYYIFIISFITRRKVHGHCETSDKLHAILLILNSRISPFSFRIYHIRSIYIFIRNSILSFLATTNCLYIAPLLSSIYYNNRQFE